MTHECQAPLPSWALLFIIRIITFIFYGCIGLKTNTIQDRLYSILLLILKEFKILCVPFVDFDGVVDGDQGKGRNSHDHNRDYCENEGWEAR